MKRLKNQSLLIHISKRCVFSPFASPVWPSLPHSPRLPPANCRAVVNTVTMLSPAEATHTSVSEAARGVPCASNCCALGIIIWQARGTRGER